MGGGYLAVYTEVKEIPLMRLYKAQEMKKVSHSMVLMKPLFISLLLLFFAGCSGNGDSSVSMKGSDDVLQHDKPVSRVVIDRGDTDRDISIEILPSEPKAGDILMVRASGLQQPVTYRWFINGNEVEGVNTPVLRSQGLKKGDRVMVNAISNGKTYRSQEVQVVNTPPYIKSAWISPKDPVKDSVLTAGFEAYDTDGDEVKVSIQWYLNDELVQEGGDRFDGMFEKGDLVVVKFIPDDGEDQGKPVIREATIKNSPPVIKGSLIDTSFKNGVYTAKVDAEDPDGDGIVYTLKEGPEGVDIEEETGRFSWKIPENEGSYDLIISVRDEDGAETLVTIPLKVKKAGNT